MEFVFSGISPLISSPLALLSLAPLLCDLTAQCSSLIRVLTALQVPVSALDWNFSRRGTTSVYSTVVYLAPGKVVVSE